MPALFVFLLKVNVALLLFCAGYYLVLRHLTFYTLNRFYLLAAIVFASIYPQINLSDFVKRYEGLAKPVQQVVINWQAPAQALVKQVDKPNYWLYVEAIFWIGAGLLAIRLMIQLFSLYRLYKSSQPATIGNHRVRVMNTDVAPFSFWQSIFVNPANHEPADLKAILLHEQVHVNQWHTADILLAEFSSIFYWFNPGIWLMKKAIRENIEFITDQKILKKGIDSKTYQYSLVSVSFSNTQPGIVNHFNLSTIKKRIIMMNAKRSSKINLTRYAFLVPAVIAMLLVFSISKADFVKKSAAFKSITILSNNVGNAVGINKMAATIKSILPGKDENKTSAAVVKDELNNNNSDALFYIDGAEVSKKLGFGDDTESIDYITAADAKKYFNAGDDKHIIAYSTRKNSAAGKAIREKIAQLVATGKIKVNSVNKEAIERVNTKVHAILKEIADHDGSDTTKKRITFSISGSDSVVYYINGKKGNMQSVNPNDIESINVFKGGLAKGAAQLVNENIGDNVGVIFITTKNSAEGLKLKEKLDSYLKVHPDMDVATATNFSDVNLKGKEENVIVSDVKITGDTLKDANGKTKTIFYKYNVSTNTPGAVSAKPLTGVVVTGYGNKTVKSNIKIKGVTANPGSATMNDDDGPEGGIAVAGTSAKNITVTKKLSGIGTSTATTVTSWSSTPPHQIIVVNGKRISDTLTTVSGADVIYIRRPADSTKASPLILIDGKEASSRGMKDLNPDDIDKMLVLKNDAAIKKYGDKAKQGVIMITLKKKK